MALIKCPECKQEVNEGLEVCDKCGFDLALYQKEYERIYNEKLRRLNDNKNQQFNSQIVYQDSLSQKVHKPRCPYCNSENLTRITAMDKAINIAMFGVLGNKRKYQWHCNNCKTNW